MAKAVTVHKHPLAIETLDKFRKTLIADDVDLTRAINGRMNSLERMILMNQVLQRTERIVTALLEERIDIQGGI